MSRANLKNDFALVGTSKRADQAQFNDFLPPLITRLAYEIELDLAARLRRLRINVTRWRILSALATSDGLTINEIVDRAMMQQSALSRALTSMEKERFVRRTPGSRDARYVEVYLTDKGRALIDSLQPVLRRRDQRLLEGLSEKNVADALELIRRLRWNIYN